MLLLLRLLLLLLGRERGRGRCCLGGRLGLVRRHIPLPHM
jgi:hypothetical protein